MSKALTIPAAALCLLAAAGTAFAEYPTFQLNGLPITRHQAQIVGSAQLKEMLAPPAASAAMPATPHQALVLAPRQRAVERQVAEATGQVVQLRLPQPRPVR